MIENEHNWFNFSIIASKTLKSKNSIKGTLIKNLIVSLGIALFFYYIGWKTFAIIIVLIGSSIGLLGIISSKNFQKLFSLFGLLGDGIAKFLQYVLLLPFLWLLFPLLRLTAFWFGGDRMQRDPNSQPSYWIPRTNDIHSDNVYVPYSYENFHSQSKYFKILTAQIVFALLIFMLAEGVFRLYGYGTPVLYISPLEMGYMLKPNQSVVRPGGLVSINSFGMRSDEVTREKPEGVYRVFIIGDSCLYGGSYLDQSEIFSEILKKIMNENLDKLPGTPQKVEVLSMAVNGWGPRHKYGYLKKYGFFNADQFIIFMPVQDIHRPKYGLENLPYIHKDLSPKYAWEEIFNHLAWRVRTHYRKYDLTDEFSRDGIETYVKIAQFASKSVPRVSFFINPHLDAVIQNKHTDPFYFELKERVENSGFTDFFTPVSELHKYKDETDLYTDKIHFGKLGSQVSAQLYANHLLQSK